MMHLIIVGLITRSSVLYIRPGEIVPWVLSLGFLGFCLCFIITFRSAVTKVHRLLG